MKRPFIAEPVRTRIVQMLIKGYTYQQTADAFSVGPATVNRIWRRYRETGKTSLSARGSGQRPKISPAQQQDFRNMVDAMPDATYEELTVSWRRLAKVTISRAAIVRMVLKLGFTRKKKTKKAVEKTTKKNRAKRASFLFHARRIPTDSKPNKGVPTRGHKWAPKP